MFPSRSFFLYLPRITFRHLNIYAHPAHYWRYLFLFIIKFSSCSMHRALSRIHVFNYLNWRPGRPPPPPRSHPLRRRKEKMVIEVEMHVARVKIRTISNVAAYFDFMDNMIMSPLCEISLRIQLLCNSSVAINTKTNKKCFTEGARLELNCVFFSVCFKNSTPDLWVWTVTVSVLYNIIL